MKLLRGLQQISDISKGTATTIGNFDGVHLGHQALLEALRYKASDLKLQRLVILFEPPPREFFKGREAPARLSSFREKLEMLDQSGVDLVYCVQFNNQMASMKAAEFANRYIFSLLRTRYLLIGSDFRFGQDRLGDITLLNELAFQQSCIVETFPDYFLDKKRVSSTSIRSALKQGMLKEAAEALGRPYSMYGRVIRGDGRGGQWGVPTANINIHRVHLPLQGVFCVNVHRLGKPSIMGVANIGSRPTVDGRKNSLEVHLFEVKESLYGEFLRVEFLYKLRDEMKFPTVDALIGQIHQDVNTAKAYCAELI